MIWIHSDDCLTLFAVPAGSPSNTLLIKSDTVEDVPCSDTAEVSDLWDWSLWGMVAWATCVRLVGEDLGDFCSSAVMHMHMHGGIGMLLADYFSCQLLVVDVYPCFCVLVGGFPVAGGSRADFRFRWGGMVSTTVRWIIEYKVYKGHEMPQMLYICLLIQIAIFPIYREINNACCFNWIKFVSISKLCIQHNCC